MKNDMIEILIGSMHSIIMITNDEWYDFINFWVKNCQLKFHCLRKYTALEATNTM